MLSTKYSYFILFFTHYLDFLLLVLYMHTGSCNSVISILIPSIVPQLKCLSCLGRNTINVLSRHQIHYIQTHPKPCLVTWHPVSTRLYLWQSCVWLDPSWDGSKLIVWSVRQEACEVLLWSCPSQGDTVVYTWGLWSSSLFTKTEWGKVNSAILISQTNWILTNAARKEEIFQSLRLGAFYLLHNKLSICLKSYLLRGRHVFIFLYFGDLCHPRLSFECCHLHGHQIARETKSFRNCLFYMTSIYTLSKISY